jgi:hypothetical protein
MSINNPPTTPRQRFVFRVRAATDVLWLVVGGVALGLTFGNVGILVVLLGVGVIDTSVELAARRAWSRREKTSDHA